MAHRPLRKGTYQTTTHLAVVVVVVILFVAVGYFFLIPQSRTTMEEELQSNRDLWNKVAPSVFNYNVDPECDCSVTENAPYRVEFENGYMTAEFEDLSHMTSGSDGMMPPNALSIERAFQLVEKAIGEADSVQVQYDRSYGFPSEVTILWSQQDPDDYFLLRIDNFRIVRD